MDALHALPTHSLASSGLFASGDRPKLLGPLAFPSAECLPARFGHVRIARRFNTGYCRSKASGQALGRRRLCPRLRESLFCSLNVAVSPQCRQTLQVQAAKKTFSTFDDLLISSEVPLLVDFYATWCGPCQFMVPILDDVGRTLKDEIRIVKIDTEKYPSIASRYGVQALPTFILFQDGKPIDRMEGALSAPDLVSQIREKLANSKAKGVV